MCAVYDLWRGRFVRIVWRELHTERNSTQQTTAILDKESSVTICWIFLTEGIWKVFGITVPSMSEYNSYWWN